MVDNERPESFSYKKPLDEQGMLLRIKQTSRHSESLRNKKLEIIPFSLEQLSVLDKINQAASRILPPITNNGYLEPEHVLLYRVISTTTVNDSYNDYEEPYSIYDPVTNTIFVRDLDIQDKSGEYNNNLLSLIYSHELAHYYGITHNSNRKSKKIRKGFWPDLHDKYRGMAWLDEAATTYLASEIKYEAGFSASSQPKPADWSDRPIKFQNCFEALASNLSKYRNYSEHKEQLEKLHQILSSLNLDLNTADLSMVKRLLIFARLNGQIHNELVLILKTAYSQKPPSKKAYSNMWDQLNDDIGIFSPITTKPEDFNL